VLGCERSERQKAEELRRRQVLASARKMKEAKEVRDTLGVTAGTVRATLSEQARTLSDDGQCRPGPSSHAPVRSLPLPRYPQMWPSCHREHCMRGPQKNGVSLCLQASGFLVSPCAPSLPAFRCVQLSVFMYKRFLGPYLTYDNRVEVLERGEEGGAGAQAQAAEGGAGHRAARMGGRGQGPGRVLWTVRLAAGGLEPGPRPRAAPAPGGDRRSRGPVVH